MRFPELDYSSPTRFTFKQRVALASVPPLLYGAFSLLFGTCRWRVEGRETLDALLARDGGCIVPFWHESMAFAAWIHRGCGGHTLTSYSFDGELAARIVRWFGMEAVRGSSSRGGGEGLRQLVRACELGVPLVGFTLDGPRGPRRVAKTGDTASSPLCCGFAGLRPRSGVFRGALPPVQVVGPFSSALSLRAGAGPLRRAH